MTRCTINFCEYNKRDVVAKIYRDAGRPVEVEQDLRGFFHDMESHCTDPRFFNAPALAAKYIVWQASAWFGPGSLDFKDLCIVTQDPMDIDYTYFVICRDKAWPEIVTERIFRAEAE